MPSLNSGDTKSTHYSQAFNPEIMKTWAKKALPLIKTAMALKFPGHIPVLLYSGMSGVAHAMYLSNLMHSRRFKHEHIYIRKKREKSHGRPVEYSAFKCDDFKKQKYVLVFVDDFISTGSTVNYCLSRVISSGHFPDRVKFSGIITATYKRVHHENTVNIHMDKAMKAMADKS
jgi:orotate phosphoribosyltransferase